MSLYQSLHQKVGKQFGQWMKEQNEDELKDFRSQQIKSRLEQIARDVIGSLSASEMQSVILSGPEWIRDVKRYVESHSPPGPDQRVRKRSINFDTLQLCLSWRENIMEDHWDEWVARRVMRQKEANRDMPRYKNWELPQPDETLRALVVEAQNYLIDEMEGIGYERTERSFHKANVNGEEIGIDSIEEVWQEAVRSVVPSGSVSNLDRLKEIYDANQAIIDYYAEPNSMTNEEGLYEFMSKYIASGIGYFLDDHFEEAIEGLYGSGKRIIHVRVRPQGYEVEAVRPAHPLQ